MPKAGPKTAAGQKGGMAVKPVAQRAAAATATTTNKAVGTRPAKAQPVAAARKAQPRPVKPKGDPLALFDPRTMPAFTLAPPRREPAPVPRRKPEARIEARPEAKIKSRAAIEAKPAALPNPPARRPKTRPEAAGPS